MRRASAILTLIGVITLSGMIGCTSSTTPATTFSQLTYTGVGASDAVGVGAVQCPTAGTPAMPTPASCPGGTGYVPDLAKLLSAGNTQVTLVDLGISGAVIGPDIRLDTMACFNAPGDILTSELPLVNTKSNLVTIFTGGNDTDAIVACAVAIVLGGGDPTAFINTELGKFGADYGALVGGIKAATPASTIIVVSNLPNFAAIPAGTTQPPGVQMLLGEVSVGIDQAIINPSAGVAVSAVVDALCNLQSYNPSNFSADGFHPNAVGYAAFAQLYNGQYAAAKAGSPALPAAHCPPFQPKTLQAHQLTPADVAGAHVWRY